MLSKNIRVYVEILPSFAVEGGGDDILQHPVCTNDIQYMGDMAFMPRICET